MAIKLRSPWRGQQSALLYKTATFALALTLAAAAGLSFLPVLFFAAVTASLYAIPTFRASRYAFACAILVVLAVLLTGRAAGAAAVAVAAVAATTAFYLLLGLKQLFFVYRDQWHYLLTLLLSYLLAAYVHLSMAAPHRFSTLTFAAVATFLLWREFFAALPPPAVPRLVPSASPGFQALCAAVIALLTVEAVWVVSALPLEPINAANLTFLIVFAVSDILRRWVTGELTRTAALTTVTVLIGAAILMFAASSWSIG